MGLMDRICDSATYRLGSPKMDDMVSKQSVSNFIDFQLRFIL